MPSPAAPPRPPAPAPGRACAREAPSSFTLVGRALPLLSVLLVLLVLCLPGAPAAAMVPSTVLPGEATGMDIELDPPVVRAPEGRAEVDVIVGDAAPGDVVVHLEVHEPAVGPAGVVAIGPVAADASVTAGSRLRPGERLRTVVTTEAPALLVVTAHTAHTASTSGDQGASDGPGDAPQELVALVLPGTPGSPPVPTLEVVDGDLQGTLEVDAPTLVSVRLRGATSTTYPDRLVLPGAPLVVRGEPAPWPLASVLTVTDEADRTITASTDRGALLGITALVLVLAAGATVHRWRRRRRTVTGGAASGSSPR